MKPELLAQTKRWMLRLTLVAWLAAPLATGLGEGLRPVAFTSISLGDAFWTLRLATNHKATIPHVLSELEKQGSLGGFRILAGGVTEKYRGYMWGDSDVYKTLEGITAALRLQPDTRLYQEASRWIETLTAAQAPDGYLFPHLQLAEPGYRRFSEETSRTCESYSMGHLIESAVEHYRLTGQTNFLAVGRKAAERIQRAHAAGELLVSGHPQIELALVKLYEVTGEATWLETAVSLIENARHMPSAWSQGAPPLAGEQARGHAVAMLYLFAAATDAARIRHDGALAETLSRRWMNVVSKKLYLTGGLGHRGHGEGFAADYDLPNDVAYAETCAGIANVFWQHRRFLATGDVGCIDVLERSLYNSVLAGVSLTGNRFFYVNPLAADGVRPFNQGLAGRFAWTECPCCPVNIVRFLPRVGDYIYAVREDAVFVNLYAQGEAQLRIAGEDLGLRQETLYPWQGRVRITITQTVGHPITLHLRVPGWARGQPVPSDLYRDPEHRPEPVRLWLNGASLPVSGTKGYAQVHRTWTVGDTLELDLPMEPRRITAHDQVAANRDRVALQRGPLVYCVEGVDHQGSLGGLWLPDDAELKVQARPSLLGGVTVITAMGCRQPGTEAGERATGPLTFIPYYAWNHRGNGPMMVWVPRHPRE